MARGVFWRNIGTQRVQQSVSKSSGHQVITNYLDAHIARKGASVMAYIGYARVSTGDQTLDLQRDALREAGCIDIYEDYASGATTARAALVAALRACRTGDSLVIWAEVKRYGLGRRKEATKPLAGTSVSGRIARR